MNPKHPTYEERMAARRDMTARSERRSRKSQLGPVAWTNEMYVERKAAEPAREVWPDDAEAWEPVAVPALPERLAIVDEKLTASRPPSDWPRQFRSMKDAILFWEDAEAKGTLDADTATTLAKHRAKKAAADKARQMYGDERSS